MWWGSFQTLDIDCVNLRPQYATSSGDVPIGLCKYQMLSPELLHHLPLVLLLPPDVFKIFLPANARTPSLFHHNGGEFVVLHAPVVKVLVPIFPLVISKYAANLFADINLGIAVINEVVKLGVIFLLTLGRQSPR